MRLDHLLSKEHFSRWYLEQSRSPLAETVSDSHVVRLELMGGTLTTSPAYRPVLSDRPAVDISTHCWVLKEQTFFPGKKYDPLRSSEIPAFFEGAGPEIPVWVGVLFENCTVDASIFVSKCVRAYGGCLGTRSR